MAPKAKRRSSSSAATKSSPPTSGQSQRSRAGSQAASSRKSRGGSPKMRRASASPNSSLKARELKQLEVESAPARRATPPKPEFVRPDEAFFQAVVNEVVAGVETGSVEYIYELLREGQDVNECNELGHTPLAAAAATGNAPLVSLLLERHADPTRRSVDQGELPLHFAARRGHRVVCALLLPGISDAGLVDEPSNTGHPPLHLAAAGGHVEVIRLLVRSGAKADSRNMALGGITALHAAVAGCHAEVAEALLDNRVPVDAPDRLGRGALHTAALRCDAPMVSLLLRARADSNRKDPDGRAPLDLVPSEGAGRDRVVKLLSAYSRSLPARPRTDAHFHRPAIDSYEGYTE